MRVVQQRVKQKDYLPRNRMALTALRCIKNPAQTAKVAVCADPFYPAWALRQIVWFMAFA